LYLALEHPVGVTLAEALRRDGPFRPKRAVRLAIGIAEPLEAAHMMGVVHGCLRPEDVVLVGPDEGVKLTQFGLDWVRTSRWLSRRGARVIGAPSTPYQAPEQLLTGEATHQSDVFAVGALLYEMLAGRPPGSRPTTRRRGGVLPLRKLRPDASRTLERIVMRALSPLPSRRHRDMTDLFNDLWSEISPFSSARRQDRGTGQGGRGGRTRALAAAGVLVVAAGAAILLGAAWLGERDSLRLLRQPAPTPAEVASPLPPVAPAPLPPASALPPAPALPPAVAPLPTPPPRPAVRDVVPSPVPPAARVVPPRSGAETAPKPVAVDVPRIPRGVRALPPPTPAPTPEPTGRDSSNDGGAIIDWLFREGSAARR
jgi:eukaryotic-like serine/threonine-protein kinase